VAENDYILDEMGITHILTVGAGMPPLFPHKYVYRVFEIQDEPQVNIKKHFDSGIKFIK
jgi:hypothetical protein